MAGFGTNGDVSVSETPSGGNVVFCLKSSKGKSLKTYSVPDDQAAQFEASISSDEPNLRQQLGETDPLRLIRISRCF
jgi:hypothetical protein